MAIPALTVPITADDTALRAGFDRARAAVTAFSTTGVGSLDAIGDRARQVAGNLGERLDLSDILGRSGKSARESAAAFEELLRGQEETARAAAAVRAQLDPLAAAQIRLNEKLSQYTSLAAAGAISTKEQAAASEMAQRAYAAEAKTLDSSAATKKSFVDTQTKMGASLRDTFGVISQSDRQAASLQKLFNVGPASASAAAVKALAKDHTDLAAAVGKSDGAQKQHGATLNQYALQQESGHVVRAIEGVTFAGGSPIQALEFELPRLAEIIGSPGGVNALLGTVTQKLQGFGTLALAVVNPVTAVAASVVGLAAAAGLYAVRQDEMALKLATTGRVAGVTLEQLNRIAAQAAGGRVSTSQAQTLAGNLVGARVDPSLIVGATQGADQLARATGASWEDASKTITAALVDPKRGFDDLNKSLGGFDAGTRETITRLEAQGNRIGAQNVLLDAMQTNIRGVGDRTWTWAKAWDGLGTAASNALAKVGQLVNSKFDPTISEQLDAAKKRLDAELALQSPKDSGPAVPRGTVQSGFEDEAIQRRRDALARSGAPSYGGSPSYQEYQRRNALIVTSRPGDEWGVGGAPIPPGQIPGPFGIGNQGDVNRLSFLKLQDELKAQSDALQSKAGDLSEKVVPGIHTAQGDEFDRVDDLIKNISKAFDELGQNQFLKEILDNKVQGRDRLTGATITGTAALTQSQAVADYQKQSRLTDYAKESRASELAVAATNARTLGEKIAVEQERTRIELAGKGILAQEAQNAVLLKATELQAQANRAAADKLVQADRELAVAGKSEYERNMIRFGHEDVDYRREVGGAASVPTPGYTAPAGVAPPPKYAPSPIVPVTTTLVAPTLPKAAEVTPPAGLSDFDLAKWVAKEALARKAAAGYDPNTSDWARGGKTGVDPRYSDIVQSPYGTAPSAGPAITGLVKPPDLTTVAGIRADEAKVPPSTEVTRQRLTDRQQAYRRDYEYDITQASKGVDTQNASLKVQIDTFGQSTAAVTGAAKAQELLNSYYMRGIPVSDQMRLNIDAYGRKVTEVTKKQEDFAAKSQLVVGTLDTMRDVSKGALSTLSSDLEQGKSAAETLSDVLSTIRDKLVDKLEDTFINQLLGKSGTASSGLLSGLGPALAGIFGRGTPAAAPLNIGVPQNAAGTPDWKGGLTWVGEKGPELTWLPPHAQIYPNGTGPGGSNDNSSGGGDTHYYDLRGSNLTESEVAGAIARSQGATVSSIRRALPGMIGDVQRRGW